MNPENRPMHSMEPREHSLALEVLLGAWERLRAELDMPTAGEMPPSIMAAVHAEVDLLTGRHADVTDEFAQHIGAAAVWYLDRATRRVGDPGSGRADACTTRGQSCAVWQERRRRAARAAVCRGRGAERRRRLKPVAGVLVLVCFSYRESASLQRRIFSNLERDSRERQLARSEARRCRKSTYVEPFWLSR